MLWIIIVIVFGVSALCTALVISACILAGRADRRYK